MKKITPAILALFLCAWGHLAFAQMASFFPGPGTVHTTGGGGFTGPCDVSGVTCVAYWSAGSCATSAYSGSTVDVVDTATGNTTGTRLQCSAGVVSALVSGSACTFITGNACSTLATTCAVSCVWNTVYNQSGTAIFPDMNGACCALGARSLVVANVLNSLPCFSNTSGLFGISTTVNTSSLALPITYFSVVERTGNFTSIGRIIANSVGNVPRLSFNSAANQIASNDGVTSAPQTATDSAFHRVMAVFPGTAAAVTVVDGVAGTAGSVGSSNLGPTAVTLMTDSATGGSGSGFTGFGCAFGITNNALNSTQYGALDTVLNTIW